VCPLFNGLTAALYPVLMFPCFAKTNPSWVGHHSLQLTILWFWHCSLSK